MGEGNSYYSRYILQEDYIVPSYSVYGLVESSDCFRIEIPSFVRFEQLNFTQDKSGYRSLLRGREGARWAPRAMTSIVASERNGVYVGSFQNGMKHLLLMHFSVDRKTLVIDYFHGAYPNSSEELNGYILNHLGIG